jgi:hypothetical protein
VVTAFTGGRAERRAAQARDHLAQVELSAALAASRRPSYSRLGPPRIAIFECAQMPFDNRRPVRETRRINEGAPHALHEAHYTIR